METWITLFIILAIVICAFALVYVSLDFVYDTRERRRERKANAKAAEDGAAVKAQPLAPDYAIVPKGMMLLPVDYAAKSEIAAASESSAVAATAEQPQEEERVVDENAVVITNYERKTVDEAYAELTKDQKGFFDGLLAYAKSKGNAIEYRTKTEVQIKADRKQIVRLAVKKGVTVAKFRVENDLMKQFRKNEAETKIEVKDTKIKVVDVAAFDTAKGLIDVAVENNAREKEAAKEPYEFLKLNDIETPDPDGNPEPEPKVNGKWDTTNINSRAFTVTVK